MTMSCEKTLLMEMGRYWNGITAKNLVKPGKYKVGGAVGYLKVIPANLASLMPSSNGRNWSAD